LKNWFNLTAEQQSTLHTIVVYLGGFATAFGIFTVAEAQTLATSFDHIVNGVKEIAIGVGPLAALGAGLWSRYLAKPSVQVATVGAMPGVTVVATPALVAAAGAPPQDVKSSADVKIVAK